MRSSDGYMVYMVCLMYVYSHIPGVGVKVGSPVGSTTSFSLKPCRINPTGPSRATRIYNPPGHSPTLGSRRGVNFLTVHATSSRTASSSSPLLSASL